VLLHLNSQDGYIFRRTCHARRTTMGARTKSLILTDEDDQLSPLDTLQLPKAFPAVSSIVTHSSEQRRDGWSGRFCHFVERNLAALTGLHALDVGYDTPDYLHDTCLPLKPEVFASIAALHNLQSLSINTSISPDPIAWRTLSQLTRLTSLKLSTFADPGCCLDHITSAAPQLRELEYIRPRQGPLLSIPEDLLNITRLCNLASLKPQANDGAVLQVSCCNVHVFPKALVPGCCQVIDADTEHPLALAGAEQPGGALLPHAPGPCRC
jgi:hypothetical protein